MSMRPGMLAVAVVLLQLLAFLLLISSEPSPALLQEKRSLSRALGLSDLAIATDCYSARNPSTVDFSGCFRDLPAQLCYHASCTGIGRPVFAGFDTRIEVER